MTWTTQPRSKGAGDLTYWREGTGTPVVLIHGVGLRAEAWAGVMPHLAHHHTVYAVDMPGHGKAPLGVTQTLGEFAARLSAFVASLGQPAAVAGHSMGAMLALMIADQLPAKVTVVAALNAIYKRTPEAAKAVQARAGLLDTHTAPDPSATLARWFGDAPTGDMAAARDACNTWLCGVDLTGYKAAYHCFAHQDGPEDAMLTSLNIPALFMTAQGDGNSTPQMSHAMAALAPKGVAKTLPDAAHMMPMTHPSQTATALLDTFRKAKDV